MYALITGGGAGIGRGIALALARRGVNVALCGRRTRPLQRVAAEAEALGVATLAVPSDVTEAAARAELLAAVRAAWGPLDILVNNAGVLAGGALAMQTSSQVAQALLTNLLAPIELTRLAWPDLQAQRGRLIFIGSSLSFVPQPFATLYTASKMGLRGFVEALRYEAEPSGVQIMMAYPPAVRTAMTAGMAAAAGASGYRLLAPEAAGEHIVRALFRGQGEVAWGLAEQTLRRLFTLAPGLVRRGLTSQRWRWQRMMSEAGQAVDASSRGPDGRD